MAWSLYESGKFLKPLKFSNGKTQEDVVNEVVSSVREGYKIMFIHGICGTGKSAVALNLAKKLGKTSIIVPIKNLQEQYKKDYESKKYVLKEDKEKLKINVITGRKNHKCKFLEDNNAVVQRMKKEIDSKLHDIFEFHKKNKKEKDTSADNETLPCRIEILERNWNYIKEYLKNNKEIDYHNFLDIKDVKRISIAGACPYWCPVIPSKYELGGKSFSNAVKLKYEGLNNTEFIFYKRKQGCGFYEQFDFFVDSDVIVFNSSKYLLESILNRKPKTEVEVIDECDEFLDKFTNQKSINLDRLQKSLASVANKFEELLDVYKDLNQIIIFIKANNRVRNALSSEEIIPLRETGVYDLLKIVLKNREALYDLDDENYLIKVKEIAMMFEDFLEESYVTFSKKEDNLIANIVTINLAKRFREITEKNKVVVLMSGTLHSENILRNIFGLENFKIIEAETEKQGRIEIKKTGLESDCKYSNFSNGKLKRERYLYALDKCIEISKKPTLVHVNAFSDMPSESEIDEFKLNNLVSREKLKQEQEMDKRGCLVESFKKGEINILFSTKTGRGIDFPGEQCNSIVFTKYPNPNVQDVFWKVLAKTKPAQYWEFYRDKARRELWQKIYRGLRFKEDFIYLLSPDSRVLEAVENENNH